MSGRGEQVQQVVGTSAVVIGAANVITPRASARFWDIQPESAPVVIHLGRIYGIALAALGAVTLRAGKDERRGLLQVAAAVGVGTAAADLLAWSTGRLGARGAVTGAVAAGGLGALAWAGAGD